MDEAIGYILGPAIAIGVILAVVGYVLAFLLTLAWVCLTTLCLCALVLADWLMAAHLLPGDPWAGWMLCGGVLGAAGGFWTIAPAYGMRSLRPAILALPVIGMVCLAILVGGAKTPTHSAGIAEAMVGTWTGTLGRNEITLRVASSSGTTFAGTLDVQGQSGYTCRLEVQGNMASKSDGRHKVHFKETRILKESRTGGWSRGSNTGYLASDGQSASGDGVDNQGSRYQWSLTKD